MNGRNCLVMGPFYAVGGAFYIVAGTFYNVTGPFFHVTGPFFNMTGEFYTVAGPFYSVAAEFYIVAGMSLFLKQVDSVYRYYKNLCTLLVLRGGYWRIGSPTRRVIMKVGVSRLPSLLIAGGQVGHFLWR